MRGLLVILCLLYEAISVAVAEEPWVTPQPLNVFQNKCIEDLGCFYTGPPFYHPLYRPISPAPKNPTETKFLLYTRDSPDQPHFLNLTEESVNGSNFNPGLPTKVLIHGFFVDLTEDDIRFRMRDELLKESAYNVIIIDWTVYNKFPYQQAVANARAVGAQVAKLIKLFITTKNISSESVHLIGHSLGGQMSGWIGERIPNIGRITALDPAGPYFQHAENPVRLDPTDANFVDVIHTNGGDIIIKGLGIAETIGHMDFFPNGGTSQPGCFLFSNVTVEIHDPFAAGGKGVYLSEEKYLVGTCHHSRSNILFTESINNCKFHGVQCEKYSSFKNGECGNVTAEMGFRATKLTELNGPARFFLKTDEEPPYCQNNQS